MDNKTFNKNENFLREFIYKKVVANGFDDLTSDFSSI